MDPLSLTKLTPEKYFCNTLYESLGSKICGFMLICNYQINCLFSDLASVASPPKHLPSSTIGPKAEADPGFGTQISEQADLATSQEHPQISPDEIDDSM